MRRALTHTRRAVALATVLLAMSAVVMSQAAASTVARATSARSVTSATWKATPSSTTFSFPRGGAPPPQYLSVTNNGDLGLVGATYTLTVSGRPTGAISVRACTLGWNETLNRCAGVITTILTDSTSPRSVSTLGLYPAAAGSSIRLQII